VRPRFELEARLIELIEGDLRVVVAMSVAMQWEISASLVDLANQGVPLDSLYVILKHPQPGERRLVGRIKSLNQDTVELDETMDGRNSIKADLVRLEGSKLSFKRCLSKMLGQGYRDFETQRESWEAMPVSKAALKQLFTTLKDNTCISVVRDRDLKARLSRAKTMVERQSEIYDEKATDSRLYQLRPHAAVGEVTDVEMIKVYTERMVPKGRPGRPYYDRIFSKPVHGRCPFCGIGTVNTLDHYLPKTHFPVFSVTPNNLVPACSWCQGEKREYFPSTKAGQIIHPYFDDFGKETWLSATVARPSWRVQHLVCKSPNHQQPGNLADGA
jgi:hypothetical protein